MYRYKLIRVLPVAGNYNSPAVAWTPQQLTARRLSSLSSSFSVTQVGGLTQFPRADKQKNEFKEQIRKNLKPDKSLDLTSGSLNPDTFGNLSDSRQQRKLASEYLADDDDGYDTLNTIADKKHPQWYKWQFKEMIEQDGIHGLKKALELFRQMKAEDGFCPEKDHYTFLIRGCAEAGYTQKAFELFDEILKNREHYFTRPTHATITSLFKSCHMSPFPEYGLEKAKYLRDYLQSIEYPLNQSQYHSMIAAFGKCGDLQTAFELLDEMAQNKVKLNIRTIGMLLIGCSRDKEKGFTHAIGLMRRMKFYRFKPTIDTYHALLKVVHECKLGSLEDIEKLIHDWDKWDPTKASGKVKKGKILAGNVLSADWTPIASDHKDVTFTKTNESDSVIKIRFTNDLSKPAENSEPTPSELLPCLPNLLAPTSDSVRGQVIGLDIKSLVNPVNKFALLGGIDGLLEMISNDGLHPNIKTFHHLIRLTPLNRRSEFALVDRMDSLGVQPDMTFFNMIMKRAAVRSDVTKLRPILEQMTRYGLSPDVTTFTAMAMGCKTCTMSQQLIGDMETCGIEPNGVICNTIASNAHYRTDFWQAIFGIDLMYRHGFKVTRETIESLEELSQRSHDTYAAFDHGKISELPHELANPKSRDAYNKFTRRYAIFKKNAQLEEVEHPWKQFEVPNSYGRQKMDEFERMMKEKIEQRTGRPVHPPASLTGPSLNEMMGKI